MFYVVLRRGGPEWDRTKPLEAQSGWTEHAAWMDGLVDSGFLLLGGPLADEVRVVLVIEAGSAEEVRTRLREDPWSGSHLLIDEVSAWTIRLDGRRR